MDLSAVARRLIAHLTWKIKRVLDLLLQFASSRQARFLVLALFVCQAVLLASTTRFGVPPDESNHISFIQFYANHSLGPIFNHQQPTYNLGDKTREVDYLYHYTMSLMYRILPFSTEGKLFVIRLFSVLFGLLTLLLLVRIARHLHLSAAATTVGLLIVTNLPMVLMMSSAINNDVLVWLGVALATLLLLRLWQRPTMLDLLLLVEIVVVGGLVKRTLLAFGLLFGVFGFAIVLRHAQQIRRSRRLDWRTVAILLAIVVSFGLATERIGGNMLRYHTLTPTCEQVQGVRPCRIFWANVRTQALTKLPPERPVPIAEFPVLWLGASLVNIVDIQTQEWRHEVMPPAWLTVLLSFTLVVGLAYGAYCDARAWRRDQVARQRLYVLLIGLSVLVIHLLYNYGEYLGSHVFGIALNGRYIIPGILLLGMLSAHYWSQLLARWPRLVCLVGTIVVIATIGDSGIIMMLRNSQLRLG